MNDDRPPRPPKPDRPFARRQSSGQMRRPGGRPPAPGGDWGGDRGGDRSPDGFRRRGAGPGARAPIDRRGLPPHWTLSAFREKPVAWDQDSEEQQQGQWSPNQVRRDRGGPRRGMVEILATCEQSRVAVDVLLDRWLNWWKRRGGDPRDARLVHEVVLGTLRHLARLDAVAKPLCFRPLEDLSPEVRAAIRAGLYQLFMLDRVPDHAAVQETVSVLLPGPGNLVNAVLREAQRRGPGAMEPAPGLDVKAALAAATSTPDWMVAYLGEALGADAAAAYLRRCLLPPPLTLRANTTRISRNELLEKLRGEFPDAAATQVSPWGVTLGRVGTAGSPTAWEFLHKGLAVVQDEASQIAGLLMAPAPGQRVLDLCAAPGGKATLIAQAIGMSGRLIACDRSPTRLRKIRELSTQLGLNNVIVTTTPEGPMWPTEGILSGPPFDTILVDAPCSGLGTLARRPDVKWNRQLDDIARLATLQVSLLKRVWDRLMPGGTLVYATCTLGAAENQNVIAEFLGGTKQARVDPIVAGQPLAHGLVLPASLVTPEGYFQSGGLVGDMDGFFAARIKKV